MLDKLSSIQLSMFENFTYTLAEKQKHAWIVYRDELGNIVRRDPDGITTLIQKDAFQSKPPIQGNYDE